MISSHVKISFLITIFLVNLTSLCIDLFRSSLTIFSYSQYSLENVQNFFGTFFGNVCHKCQYVLLMLLMKKKITWSLGETKLIFKCWKNNISRVSTENEWNSFHSFFTVRQCNNPYTVYFILWESVSWWTWLIIIHLGTAVTYFIMQTPNIAFWINYSTLYTATISQL